MNTNPFSSRTTSCALMHPFQWCNGCFCGLGLVYSRQVVHPCQTCGRKLAACHSVRTDVTGARGAGFNIMQTCAVCLEDFKVKDELGVLPCQHAFHRKCLVKWLEVRCVCPMCNKPIAGPPEKCHSIGTLLDDLV
ncbi:RING finger protein 122-like [Oncorhynchus clarkii lewisi]|uniref:RING finger protein 122-like n=1 Tax=Oncorhynchus clarkii lewisi TaxID=490388 RepID=UPI0039B9B4A0